MREMENRLVQNDNAAPACMAAATNNPNDIRGSEKGLYTVGS